jgi:DNA-3-methyladenine glycosylase II
MSTKRNAPAAPPSRDELYKKAVRHLARKCQVMKRLVARVGPCTWKPVSDDPFTVLVRCVIYQQISTKAAKSIFDRLIAAAGGLPIDRGRLAALTEADFRACGVSGPKQRTLRGVADHMAANPGLLADIAAREDVLLRTQLTAIKGIGPWSVDMFLMFGICRPDVLPVGDLGLRAGVRDEFGLKELPTARELEELAEPWRPYRSVATWYFWRGLEHKAQPAVKPRNGR